MKNLVHTKDVMFFHYGADTFTWFQKKYYPKEFVCTGLDFFADCNVAMMPHNYTISDVTHYTGQHKNCCQGNKNRFGGFQGR